MQSSCKIDQNSTQDQPSPICRAFINELPEEILIIVFLKSIDAVRPGRDLARLHLVCHFWESIVESTPSLWAYISAEDGIQHIQNAVTKTGEVPLDLVYRSSGDDTTISVEAFLAAVKEKSGCWRSVELVFRHGPSAYPVLQSMPCPALEKLCLWCIFQTAPLPEPFGLFGGMTAPSKLKKLTLCKVPVLLEPLKLADLESLALMKIGPQSMEEVVRILRASPNLVTLVLEDLVGLRPSNASNTPLVLQHLDTLKLRLPVPITRFLLSTLQAVNLNRLTLIANFSSIPPSMLFTPGITHWIPVLQRMVAKADKAEIEFDWSNLCSLKFGTLSYLFQAEVFDTPGCTREILDWHIANLGEVVTALPACLSYRDVCPSYGDLRVFSQLPNVTELGIAHTPSAEQVPSKLFKALGSARRTKPPQWLLPHLEVIHYNLTKSSAKYLVTMLKGRYGSRDSLDQSGDQLPRPQPLRELRFFGGIGKPWAPPKDVAFLREVHLFSGGAKIFWEDELQAFE